MRQRILTKEREMSGISRATLGRCREKLLAKFPKAKVDEYPSNRPCACGCEKKASVTLLLPLFEGEALENGEIRLRLHHADQCLEDSIEKVQKRLGELF